MTKRTTKGAPVAVSAGSSVAAWIIEEMKAAQMGVSHGAHMRWTPKTPAEREIFQAIVDKHTSGGEVLIRFGPNAPPITAAPK